MAELGWWVDWLFLFPISQDVGNASFVIAVISLVVCMACARDVGWWFYYLCVIRWVFFIGL